MSREALPLVAPDLSAFARSLGSALKTRPSAEPPGHVELLNLLARAAGHRNVQALRAASERPLPAAPLAAEDRPVLPLSANARKALMQFDSRGRLVRWPHKFSVQRLAMWVLWTLFDGRRRYSEREVNAILVTANAFGDHVTLRRELVNHRLLARKSDCSEYWKLPARPDTEAQALVAAWRARRPVPSARREMAVEERPRPRRGAGVQPGAVEAGRVEADRGGEKAPGGTAAHQEGVVRDTGQQFD
ncbi:DUF2087 domain-containing protein [Rubrivivax gelatinosus]|uniref:DUF2087 domain-containing protein n=1 Tax=Rubrivivax gelatinosus TaxID=28068 RepID=UPI001F5B4137|nr:DUF2087 domain-containing protein [Rubrivivax gelatinosus]